MNRRVFLSAVTGGLLAAPLAAEGQQTDKIARIGYLSPNLATGPHLREAFRQGLRDLGHVEGRNLVTEGGSTVVPLAAKQATRTLPIVFASVADPVGSGLVTSLARPGGNVTGLTGLTAELVGNRLELLTQAVPGVGQVAVLWLPGALGERTEKEMLTGAGVAARGLGVRLQFVEATRDRADFDRAFSDMTTARAGALTLLPSSRFRREHRRLVDLAARHRLPTVYFSRDFLDAGGLMSYAASVTDSSRRAATYVHKILKGAKPGDLPVEQPTKFELVINLKTAKALGLTIPPSLLQRADQVIE
jgi:ABC-type uncharacterized transport system substrate-binding protein